MRALAMQGMASTMTAIKTEWGSVEQALAVAQQQQLMLRQQGSKAAGPGPSSMAVQQAAATEVSQRAYSHLQASILDSLMGELVRSPPARKRKGGPPLTHPCSHPGAPAGCMCTYVGAVWVAWHDTCIHKELGCMAVICVCWMRDTQTGDR